jgi:hypothetical protein
VGDATEQVAQADTALIRQKNDLVTAENNLTKARERANAIKNGVRGMGVQNANPILRKEDGTLYTEKEVSKELEEQETLYQRQLEHVRKLEEIRANALNNERQGVVNIREQLKAMGVKEDVLKAMNPGELKQMFKDKAKEAEKKEEGPDTFMSSINNAALKGRQLLHTAQQKWLAFKSDMGWAMEDELQSIEDAQAKKLKKADAEAARAAKQAERAEKEADRAEERLRREREKNKLGDALGLRNGGLGAMIDAMNNPFRIAQNEMRRKKEDQRGFNGDAIDNGDFEQMGPGRRAASQARADRLADKSQHHRWVAAFAGKQGLTEIESRQNRIADLTKSRAAKEAAKAQAEKDRIDRMFAGAQIAPGNSYTDENGFVMDGPKGGRTNVGVADARRLQENAKRQQAHATMLENANSPHAEGASKLAKEKEAELNKMYEGKQKDSYWLNDFWENTGTDKKEETPTKTQAEKQIDLLTEIAKKPGTSLSFVDANL